ncbi:UBX domain-containing protein-like protein [Emericellopsis cladophorae]|uniref:UBX domain-containing protein-like protein n=1 Tax=Emericellopsis cladophorae TaxID=2686198 RepID=A0A9Q0BAS1_9HYPO|nr:UBX domain-containing protein-like protein [Emericellopsis cladophorae]KAI6777981.1 UBX domain-containing protein-like protein [Emericellopsis cladophorae]
MADSNNAEDLSAPQQDALQQYIAVTNQEPKDAIPLLRRSQWNVQIAVAKFFDGEGPDPVAEALAAQDIPREAARHENLQESLWAAEAAPSRARRPGAQTDAAPRIVPQQPVTGRSPWLVGLLLTPLSWSWTAASSLFRTFVYILSFLPAPLRPRALTSGPAGLKSNSGRRMLMPRDTAARFKREFDEEYSANELPFYEGGFAQAHDQAKKDLKFLLTVILSPEHDDTESFVKETLLDPQVVQFVNDPTNNIILWGGNVLDSEAYQVSTEYKCTKFPFSALICLTPKEGSTRMGVIKRLVGPTPAATYVSEMQAAMEKYGGDLANVRAERTAQEVTRSLRTEQDSAYERSLAIDRERARQKKEAAEAAAAAEERAEREAAQAAILEQKRAQWRTWRATKLHPEPPSSDKSVVRVALMMPEETGAGRITRRFAQDAAMEELYAFVECYGVTTDGGEDYEKPDGYEHEYSFRIASTLPREVYEPSQTATMGERIGRSGNLIVEQIVADSDSESEDGSEEDA